MSKLIKAISIDPTKRTIEEVEIEANQLSALYKHIGCRTIDFVCRMPNGDALIVDDEALLTDPQPPAFKFAYFLHRIHGIALVVGSNRNGRTIEPKLTLQQVRNLTKLGKSKKREQIRHVHFTNLFYCSGTEYLMQFKDSR